MVVNTSLVASCVINLFSMGDFLFLAGTKTCQCNTILCPRESTKLYKKLMKNTLNCRMKCLAWSWRQNKDKVTTNELCRKINKKGFDFHGLKLKGANEQGFK